MTCAVHNCENKIKCKSNKHMSFFTFPKKEHLLKQWLTFCRNDKINVKTAYICSEHFDPDDIQGNLQFEMGLRTKRTLRTGSVPCINKNDMSEISKERAEEIERLNQKQMVEELLKEAETNESVDGATTPVDSLPLSEDSLVEPSNPLDEAPVDVEFIDEELTVRDVFGEVNEADQVDALSLEETSNAMDQPSASSATIFCRGKPPMKNFNRCRTCDRYFVADGHSKDLYESENSIILYQIEVITGVWIDRHEGLPQYMCASCLSDLRRAIEFREGCIRTEAQLIEQMQEQYGLELIGEATDEIEIEDKNVQHKLIERADSSIGREMDLDYADLPEVKTERTQTSTLDNAANEDDPISVALGHTILNKLINEANGNLAQPEACAKGNGRSISKRATQSRPTKAKQTMRRKLADGEKRSRRPENREYVCDQCGHVSRTRANFIMHKLRERGIKNFQCAECPMKFWNNYMRKMHVRVKHRGETPFDCRHCSRVFTNNGARHLHENKIHGIRPHRVVHRILTYKGKTRHYCDYCDRSFTSKYLLQYHINEHEGLTPYGCKFCDQRFASAFVAKTHERKHETPRYVCDTCGKGYFIRARLQYHKRSHTGERPYKCEVCNMAFLYIGNLQSHNKSKSHNEKLQQGKGHGSELVDEQQTFLDI